MSAWRRLVRWVRGDDRDWLIGAFLLGLVTLLLVGELLVTALIRAMNATFSWVADHADLIFWVMAAITVVVVVLEVRATVTDRRRQRR